MGKYMTFDVGTTAIKTCIFGEDLQRIDSSTDEYDLITENGLIELEPQTYWDTIRAAIRSIGERNDLSDVKTICLTTQGETLIPVSKEGKELHRAIVWLDDRAGKEAETIIGVLDKMAEKEGKTGERKGLEYLFEKTGVPEMNGLVPLAKLMWIRNNLPEVYENTEKFLLLEDYLIWRLSGKYVSEKSLLTSTAWFDIRRDTVWEELLKELGLDAGRLPEAAECGSLVGNLTPECARQLGLSESVKVVAGAMDQIAAAIGGGGLKDGIATATIGTAMVMTVAAPEEKAFQDSGIVVYRGYRKGQYVLLPMTNTAGVVFKWLKDTVFPTEAEEAKKNGESIYDVLCEMAAAVEPGAGGVTMIPYFQGSIRPDYVPESKGVFFGLGLDTTREVLIRATLEGIGNMIRDNVEMLAAYGVDVKTLQFFGGGSKNHIWNQIIADISSAQLIRPEEEECASLGAAILAAVAVGDIRSIEQAQALNPVKEIVVPDPSRKAVYDAAYQRYRRLFETLIPLFG